ncbi:serine/threonine protein kinase [Desulfococcus sp.]|uniref:serine/threonine protein kinase n=1 Tax=Desulfococcus sp. TaxID=2025834 RepID=UPI003593E47C
MKKIGRYIARGQLGRGGMGRVYKVEMPVTGRIVALKLLMPNPLLVDMMGMERIREMFIREAVTMANLRHPCLPEVWDFDEADGMPFYTMDYYCSNLGTMIGEGYEMEKPSRRIPTEKAVHYARQILEGLACLHYAGVIHRDIKPFNILITDHDTVKICDFGLSRLKGDTFKGPENLKVGTPWYAPPEQEKDPDAVDFSADLFPVGVMLYRMLTGMLPMSDPEPPSRINPDLDESWDRVILTAIESSPEKRFRRAGEMLAALAEIHAGWVLKQEGICRSPDLTGGGAESGGPTTAGGAAAPVKDAPRISPLKVSPKNARAVFGLDDLWRPETYATGDFAVRGEVVVDLAAGLQWERSGSEYPLTRDRALDYVRSLNARAFAGRTDWRLPTVAELMTLLVKTPHGADLCIPRVFDGTQRRLWSCDASSHIAAWYVSLDLGFVAWHDHTAYFHVRAVCGRAPRASGEAGRPLTVFHGPSIHF